MPQPRLPSFRGADLVSAGLLGLVTATNLHAFTPPLSSVGEALGPEAELPLFGVFTLVCCAAVAVRTRHSLLSVILIEGMLALHLLVFNSLSVLSIVLCLVAAETIGSRIARPWSWGLLAVLALGSAATALRVSPLFNEEIALFTRLFFVLIAAWSLIGAAYLWGLNRRRRRDRVEQAIARAEELAAHAEDRRRLAVVEERQRIARDVHDLLGHSLAVIGMQAEGARAMLAADPTRAEEALATIGELSRVGIDDLRRLVDVLREEESEQVDSSLGIEGPGVPLLAGECSSGRAPLAPETRTGLEGLIGLVERVRAAQLDIRLTLEADSSVPASVDAACSGIVHEALSNAMRHGAGPVLVDMKVRAEGVDVSVCSAQKACAPQDGSHAPQDGSHTPQDGSKAGDGPRVGTGLTTMRERAEALGGTFHAAPRSDGRWLVRAHLPAEGPGSGKEKK